MRLLIAVALIAGCEKKDESPRPAPVEPGAAPRSVAPLPEECNAYRRAIDSLVPCERYPRQSVDALKKSFDAMSRSWSENQSISAAARAAMAEACTQGTDAVKQVTSVMCGVEHAPTAEQAPVAEADIDVPRECHEYGRLTDVVTKCDKIPQQARDALRQGFEHVSRSWHDKSLPAEARASLAQSCKQATEALAQVATNVCGLQ